MNLRSFLDEVLTSSYYRRHPVEVVLEGLSRRILSRRRITDPRALLASLGVDPAAALDGVDRWLPLLERAVAGGRTYLGYPTGVNAEAGLFLYGLTRALAPEVVVETGVAAGVSTSFIAAALVENGRGTLHSIELPPEEAVARFGGRPDRPGRAIPQEIREALGGRHDLILGDVREALPDLLGRLGSVDVFFHDDFHVRKHVLWELESVWPRLRPGGALVADNVNFAWVQFLRRHALGEGPLVNLHGLAAVRKAPEPSGASPAEPVSSRGSSG